MRLPGEKAKPGVLRKLHLKTKTGEDGAALEKFSNRQKVVEAKVDASRNLLHTLRTTVQRFVRGTELRIGPARGRHEAGSAMKSQTLKKTKTALSKS